MDRRIQKSRQVIFDTFTDLMEKNTFQKISIKMITDTANVNRGTFYLHFKDKNDLRDQCIEMHLDIILTLCTGNHGGGFTSKNAMLSTFEYLEEHSSFYRVMLTGDDNAYFRKKMEEILHIGLSEYFENKKFKDNLDKTVATQFIVCAGAGLIEWWLTNKNDYNSDYLVNQFWEILNSFR
nr:TetR/AcrR family transcriptional regulator [uncultured Carboxylicivirga sp.]